MSCTNSSAEKCPAKRWMTCRSIADQIVSMTASPDRVEGGGALGENRAPEKLGRSHRTVSDEEDEGIMSFASSPTPDPRGTALTWFVMTVKVLRADETGPPSVAHGRRRPWR